MHAVCGQCNWSGVLCFVKRVNKKCTAGKYSVIQFLGQVRPEYSGECAAKLLQSVGLEKKKDNF